MGCTSKNEQSVDDKKEWVVATSGTLFPSSYYNDDNKLTGYDIEVVKEIANRMDKKVTFKELNVDGMLASIQNNSVDFAANDFSLSDSRKDKFLISEPIKYSFGSMIVRKSDQSGIKKLEDLKDKKAAGEATTSYMKIAGKYGAELISYDNATNDQYLTDVANGRTDVILNDYYLQKMSVNALPDIPVMILKDVYFNPSESGLLFNNKNQELKEEIDKTIKEMKKDGTMKKISEEFFGEDVSKKVDIPTAESVTVEE
ncbi:transporter substrate-binding domain-containing protein [Vagococcus carniphilus]|uniref:Transporter substrate-binding domain-containing protein n=2 Tax=Vagococcus carniphilus TaxID=218144 RepID=A0AAW8U5A6_9ENTE|nr:transporter substrate-binding domain-containing protein [Vagococcus carniphilus]MDT2829492.1 transporter substrate-binding domain-containing protein [Vagococcus carniphilus]MDT2833166.1 transporter substrate-binding domain-containing protein [Vagococcus carniphilus]MDT2838951.1 transporter substrate-binding domain-containing protein [Vagococcus carniphilus]MDT2847758.1 transporter substrate-binding domain-containing protein [Vagococcus carniphilus]MDT2853009.1 transporter substrate-binding 